MKMMLIVIAFALAVAAPELTTAQSAGGARVIVVDDFEGDTDGSWPRKWRFLTSRDQQFEPLDAFMSNREKFYVVSEGGNRFLRGYTEGEAQRISSPAISSEIGWRLSEFPHLSWEWRANRLPNGAREDKANDTGGAVYISFTKKDWLGRPLSIKYTYSSTLPVGTIVATGNVKVIVVSSGAERTGRWINIKRNVAEDFRNLFGSDPPEEPFTITLWSDSDDTKSIAEVDFDNIRLLSAHK